MHMAQRTGIPMLMVIAKRLCSLITNFTPIITHLYPANSQLLNALAAANAACATLYAELAEVRDYGV